MMPQVSPMSKCIYVWNMSISVGVNDCGYLEEAFSCAIGSADL